MGIIIPLSLYVFLGVSMLMRSFSISAVKCHQGTAQRNLATNLGIEFTCMFLSSQQVPEQQATEVECTPKTVVQTLLATSGLGNLVREICPSCKLFFNNCIYTITDLYDCFNQKLHFICYYNIDRSISSGVLVCLNHHNLKGVAECVVLTNDEIYLIFIKHSCDLQETLQVTQLL